MTTEKNITDQAPTPEPTQPSIFDQMDVNPITNEVVIPVPEVPAETPETPETPEKPAEKSPESAPPLTVPKDAQVPAPDLSGLSDQERQHYEHLLRQQSQVQQAQTSIQQNQALVDLQQQYVAKGYDEATAAEFAKVYQDANQRAQSQVDQSIAGQQETRDKAQTAQILGARHGVDPQALVDFESPAAMERYAMLLKSYGQLDKRVGQVEATRVEDGAYDSASSGAAPLNVAQLLAASADPDFVLTPAQQKQISQHLGLDT